MLRRAVIVLGTLLSAAESPGFNRDVLPILSANCFACHGPDERDRQAGEVHLGDQPLVRQQRRTGLRDAVDEELPRHECGVREQRVGQSLGAELRQVPEDDAEDHHGEERLDDRPEEADHRLAVAHVQVAPGEEPDELTRPPELTQTQRDPAAHRFDDRSRQGRLRGRCHVGHPFTAYGRLLGAV